VVQVITAISQSGMSVLPDGYGIQEGVQARSIGTRIKPRFRYVHLDARSTLRDMNDRGVHPHLAVVEGVDEIFSADLVAHGVGAHQCPAGCAFAHVSGKQRFAALRRDRRWLLFDHGRDLESECFVDGLCGHGRRCWRVLSRAQEEALEGQHQCPRVPRKTELV
jgi:hypothetical protein